MYRLIAEVLRRELRQGKKQFMKVFISSIQLLEDRLRDDLNASDIEGSNRFTSYRRHPTWRLAWNGTEKFLKTIFIKDDSKSIQHNESNKINFKCLISCWSLLSSQIYLQITWPRGSRVASQPDQSEPDRWKSSGSNRRSQDSLSKQIYNWRANQKVSYCNVTNTLLT